MRVAFRTDASLEIGTGHVMRCLTLADALRERGSACVFVTRRQTGDLLALIEQRGHEAVALSPAGPSTAQGVAEQGPPHAPWLGVPWRVDAEQTRAALADSGIDWLIVDHYGLDARWERYLRPTCNRVAVIDDLADRDHDCDLLLDQNVIADAEQRYRDRVPAHCGVMLGPDYALLQPQYAELRSRVRPREGAIGRILVYFGGADVHDLTGTTVAAFASLHRDDVALDVVISPASPNAGAVRRRIGGHARITLHAGLPSLAPLMADADLAIGACGATAWERCCAGLPSVVITVAEHQRPIAAELARRGLVRWHGHWDEVSSETLARDLRDLLERGLDAEQSHRCRCLVDGRGAERVSTLLSLDARTELRARLARLDDETLILEWANDALVRRNAFSAGLIDAATHRAWFRDRLSDLEQCRLYVIETTSALPVGQVRFQREGESWEIHYSLDARARGRGLAKPALETALAALRSSTHPANVFGRVQVANTVSSRVFEGLGFSADAENRGIIVYRRAIDSRGAAAASTADAQPIPRTRHPG